MNSNVSRSPSSQWLFRAGLFDNLLRDGLVSSQIDSGEHMDRHFEFVALVVPSDKIAVGGEDAGSFRDAFTTGRQNVQRGNKSTKGNVVTMQIGGPEKTGDFV